MLPILRLRYGRSVHFLLIVTGSLNLSVTQTFPIPRVKWSHVHNQDESLPCQSPSVSRMNLMVSSYLILVESSLLERTEESEPEDKQGGGFTSSNISYRGMRPCSPKLYQSITRGSDTTTLSAARSTTSLRSCG